jgi:hypothetical protein
MASSTKSSRTIRANRRRAKRRAKSAADALAPTADRRRSVQMPPKPARAAKAWNPITSLDDRDQGEYEVSDGVLTVR